MYRMTRLGGVIAGLALAQAAIAAPDMRPGQWETTVRTEMAGMPMQIPPVTHRQCLREEDLVPQVERGDQNCRLLDQAMEGDTVTWRVQCDGEGMRMEGDGTVTYGGDSYRGRLQIRTSGGSMGDMTMVQNLEGRRLGPCP